MDVKGTLSRLFAAFETFELSLRLNGRRTRESSRTLVGRWLRRKEKFCAGAQMWANYVHHVVEDQHLWVPVVRNQGLDPSLNQDLA